MCSCSPWGVGSKVKRLVYESSNSISSPCMWLETFLLPRHKGLNPEARLHEAYAGRNVWSKRDSPNSTISALVAPVLHSERNNPSCCFSCVLCMQVNCLVSGQLRKLWCKKYTRSRQIGGCTSCLTQEQTDRIDPFFRSAECKAEIALAQPFNSSTLENTDLQKSRRTNVGFTQTSVHASCQ